MSKVRVWCQAHWTSSVSTNVICWRISYLWSLLLVLQPVPFVQSVVGTLYTCLTMVVFVFAGLGMSMNMTSSIGIVPHYFEKRKAAAYSCTGLGQGISMVVFPYILSTMLETYGYKLTLLYVSPVFLLSVTAPIVFKPQTSPEKIGRAHVWTPVTWNDLVCRLLLEKKKKNKTPLSTHN